jgi:hypothetical protein
VSPLIRVGALTPAAANRFNGRHAAERGDTCQGRVLRRSPIRILGNSQLFWAVSLNPVRGDLFIVTRPQKESQTPVGVTCASSRSCFQGEPANRPPRTGFEGVIGRAAYYKQATPNGVHPTAALHCAFSPD